MNGARGKSISGEIKIGECEISVATQALLLRLYKDLIHILNTVNNHYETQAMNSEREKDFRAEKVRLRRNNF